MELNKETKELDKIMRDIHKYLVEYTKNNLKEYNLTKARFLVLWYISKNQPINMSSLHKKMYMANSTLTVIVDKLVDLKYVKRYRNPDDRREVLIELTEYGDDKLCKILHIRQSFLQKALDNSNIDEQKELINLLKPILINLENSFKEGDESNE